MGLTPVYTGSCRGRTFIPSYDEQIRKYPACPSVLNWRDKEDYNKQEKVSFLLPRKKCKCDVEPLTCNKTEIPWRFDLFWFLHNFLFSHIAF